MKAFFRNLIVKILNKKFVADEFALIREEVEIRIKEKRQNWVYPDLPEISIDNFISPEDNIFPALFEEIKRWSLPVELLIEGEILRLNILEHWKSLIRERIEEILLYHENNLQMKAAKKVAYFRLKEWEVGVEIERIRRVESEIEKRTSYLRELNEKLSPSISAKFDDLVKIRSLIKRNDYLGGFNQIPQDVKEFSPKLLAWINQYHEMINDDLDGMVVKSKVQEKRLKLGLEILEILDEIYSCI